MTLTLECQPGDIFDISKNALSSFKVKMQPQAICFQLGSTFHFLHFKHYTFFSSFKVVGLCHCLQMVFYQSKTNMETFIFIKFKENKESLGNELYQKYMSATNNRKWSFLFWLHLLHQTSALGYSQYLRSLTTNYKHY